MGGHVDGWSIDCTVIAGSPKPFEGRGVDPERILAALEKGLKGKTFTVGRARFTIHSARAHSLMPTYTSLARAFAGRGATKAAAGRKARR